jgi:2'-5' RNA ligase
MVRLFIALSLPPSLRAALVGLRDDRLSARWAPVDQAHVTLRFLGARPAEEVGALAAALDRVRAPSFTVGLAGVGTFPPPGRRQPPAVLWAGLAPAGPIVALKQAIDAAIALAVPIGPDREAERRGFTPHVTLARWREPPGPALDDYLVAHAQLRGPVDAIGAFHLYDSALGPGGPKHTVLHTVALC